jgi:hypothetical protein
MRDLRDYFLPAGTITISTIGNPSNVVVVPDPGTFVSVLINPHVVLDADTLFNVFVNAVDTTINVILLDLSADETGVELTLPARLAVGLGDAIHIESDGAQSAVTTADVTFVIRR